MTSQGSVYIATLGDRVVLYGTLPIKPHICWHIHEAHTDFRLVRHFTVHTR